MTTLIIGAAGKTGRRIVNVSRRATSPSGPPRAPPASTGTTRDWARDGRGHRRRVHLLPPRHHGPGRARGDRRVLQGGRRARRKRLVLLSGRGEAEAQRAERLMQAAGTEWTIVRCSWFAQNFSEAFMVDGVLAGEVAVPAGDVPEPFVDVEDIADVAVAALTEDGHHGQVYELTGPRALRSTRRSPRSPPPPVARSASRRAGRRVRRRHARGGRARRRGRARRLAVHGGARRPQREPQDGVRRALGRAPRDFGEYARRTAATGAW